MTTRRGGVRWMAAAAVAAMVLTGCGQGSGHTTGTTTPTTGQGSPPTTGQPSDRGAATVPPTTAATTAACTMPLTHATDVGFHIAVPSGWDLSTLNGQAVVAATPADMEAVLVFPALLTSGLTASSFFTTYLNKLDQQNAAAGVPVSTTPASGAHGLPAVNFTQTVNGTTLQGYATVEVLPLAAPGATQEAAYIAYWAPASEYPGARSELAAVSACYGPEPATPFQVFQDQVFTYAVPTGWTPSDENSNGIDLHGPDS